METHTGFPVKWGWVLGVEFIGNGVWLETWVRDHAAPGSIPSPSLNERSIDIDHNVNSRYHHTSPGYYRVKTTPRIIASKPHHALSRQNHTTHYLG